MLTNLVILKNPFNLNDRDIKRIEIENECSLKTYLEKYAPIPSEMEYHASLNGKVFTPEEISPQIVKEYDSVVVCPVLKGGRSGSNPLAILAGIALAVFSFGFVSPFVSGLFGGGALGSIAGSVAAGLTMTIGGQLISNAFSPSLKSNSDIDDVSYGWGALQSITQQGAIIPITYGTIRTAGQVLNQYVEIEDSSGKRAYEGDEYLHILLCGGEGVIDSFSDFRINDNPAANYDVIPVTRSGQNTQNLIEGFGDIYSSQAVQVTLSEGGTRRTPGEWHTVEYTGDNAEIIEVMVNFPQGLCFYSSDSSDVQSNWVCLQFQYRILSKSGSWSSWTDFVTTRWNGEECTGFVSEASKTSPFSRTCWKRVKFSSDSHDKLEVRGRVFAKDRQDAKPSQCIDNVQWSTLSGVIPSAQTHPNKALVGVRIKATDQLNGGMPTITWKQTRNKVLVFDGGWLEKDAQNPAWIIYDLIVHARNLDGTVHVFGEDPSRLDLAAFKAWADWNDRTLNNRPAIKMNLLIDESKSLWEWCNDIAASARGAVVLKGTRISCIFDAPSNPVQLFSMGNIVSGSFSGEYLSVEERANAIEIAFYNEENNYEREQITVYAEGFDDTDSRANPVSVELVGITDFERAYREGIYRLNQNKYILRTITFTADIDAIACQVGDVILVQHDIPQWGQGGRIININGFSLTLDNEIIFNPDKAYVIIIRKQTDERIQRYVTGSGTTNTVTVTSGDLSGVSVNDVFTIGQVDKAAKPFRVQEMSRTGDLQATLTCSEYIAEVYTEATNIPVIQYSDTSTSGITGLQIVSTGYYTTSGQWISEIWAYWNYIGERPSMYEIQWSYDNGIWQKTARQSETRSQCAVQNRNTVYKVRVRALYVTGLPSEWSYATGQNLRFTPSVPPDPPTDLQATGWFGYASLRWTNPPNVDFSHIEVWEGTEDDLTQALHIGNTPADSYTRLLPAGGAYWYWIRAVNLTGLKSEFNSLAGTPCVISAESHEAYITQLLEDNPYLLDVIQDLNERIEPLEIGVPQIEIEIENIKDIEIPQIKSDIEDIVDVQIPQLENDISDINEIKVPDLTGKVTDNQNLIHQNLIPALNRVGEGLLRLGDETARTRDVFRWAGIEVNEDEGTVIIRGLEDLKTETGYQFSTVEQRLDAQNADINLKASRVYVDELAASLISAIIVAEEWNFKGSLNGWTGQNATLTAQPDGMKYVITGSYPSLTSPDIAINGAANNIVGLQLQQGNGNSNFTVRIQYKTSEHEYSDSYMKRVEILGSVNVVRSVQVDMHALSYGGNDWKNSVITGIRILIDDAVNCEYLIPLVNIGQSTMSELIIAGLETRITQAEADIDGANAAIALKADATTVTALSQKLSRAEINISGLESAITLKADKTELTETTSRVQSAEQRIDALEGTISQEVSDIKILQDQITKNSDAILQNAVNDAEEQTQQRIAIAQAKQELHAEITETNEALAQARLSLIASIDENAAAIEEEKTARAASDEAEAQARENLSTQINENKSAIEIFQKAYADDKTAEAYSQRVIQAQIDELAESNLQNAANDAEGQEQARKAVAQVREELYANIEDTNKASAGYRLELLTLIEENDAQYQRDIQAVTTDLNAEISARETLAVRVGENTAGIQTEAQTRAEADEAEAQARQTLGSQVEANKSAIQTIQKTYSDDKTAEAYSQRIIQAQIDELANSSIQNAANDAEGQEQARKAVAQVREELYANIEDTNKASAGYRLELLTLIEENDAQYQRDIQAVTTDLNAEISARETLAVRVGENTAGIQTEAQTRANADGTLSSRIDTVASGVSENKSAIQTEATTRAAADEAEAQARLTLSSQVEANKSAIQTIQKTYSDDKTAEAYSKRVIQAQLDELANSSLQNAANDAEGQEQSRKAVAQVREELYANIEDTNKASAGYRLELLTLIEENDAQYQRDIQAVTTDLNAEISARETLAVRVGENKAGIQTEAQTRANADGTLSSRIDTVASGVSENKSAIQTEATTRAAADEAEAQARLTLSSQVEANKSAIQTIQKTYSDDKTAEAYSKRVIQAQLDELANSSLQNAANDAEGQEQARKAVAQVREELYANIEEANKASAGYRLELLTLINENDAQYQNDISALTTDLNSEISARETLAAKVGQNTSAIQNETTVRSTQYTTMSNLIHSVQAVANENTAAIQLEEAARVNADEAEALMRETLESTVNGHTTSIQAISQVTEGISGKYLIKIDSNGYVAGYELYNGGNSKSTFTIAADKFLITKPGTPDPKNIFVYDSSNNTLYLRNIIVDTAQIKDAAITGAKIAGGTIEGVNIMNSTVGRAKIPLGAITQVASAYANNVVSYEIPTVYIPETPLDLRYAIKPAGLEVAFNFEEGVTYYFNACFIIRRVVNYSSGTHKGICYRYQYLEPGASEVTTLGGGTCRLSFGDFSNGIPITIPFCAKYTAQNAGTGRFRVSLGVYSSSEDFTDPRDSSYNVASITMMNRFLNVLALYR